MMPSSLSIWWTRKLYLLPFILLLPLYFVTARAASSSSSASGGPQNRFLINPPKELHQHRRGRGSRRSTSSILELSSVSDSDGHGAGASSRIDDGIKRSPTMPRNLGLGDFRKRKGKLPPKKNIKGSANARASRTRPFYAYSTSTDHDQNTPRHQCEMARRLINQHDYLHQALGHFLHVDQERLVQQRRKELEDKNDDSGHALVDHVDLYSTKETPSTTGSSTAAFSNAIPHHDVHESVKIPECAICLEDMSDQHA
ncbi:unnamed protein product, partial [Amoebophrya sp. A25]|eukprot:GSA25T00001484001.1